MPHILFIILDTQRRDRLSLYGFNRPTSPRLDAFAQAARVYERATAPAQWTVSSHASMFTGLYPHQHGTTQANHRLPTSHVSVVEWLQAGGYHTVGFCNNPLLGLIDNALDRGFDSFFHYASPVPNRPRQDHLPALMDAAWRQFSTLNRRTINHFAHNQTLFRLSLLPIFTQVWSRIVNYKGSTAHSTRDLRAYWHQHVRQSEQPVFAFLNLMGTHMPLRPARAAIERIAPDMKGSAASYQWMAGYNGDGLRWISPTEEPLADWQSHALGAFYDAAAAEQDALLGTMLEAMQADGDLDDTLVIIGADHGEGLGDHGYCGHSFVVNHELTHVPWLMWWPGHIAPGRDRDVISTRRAFHTMLDAAGVGHLLPVDAQAGSVEGLSLLRSSGGAEGNIAYSEAHPAETLLSALQRRMPDIVTERQLTEVRRSITHDDYKLIAIGNHAEALYHLPTDPAETTNLLTAHPDRVAALHTRLLAFMADAPAEAVPHEFSPQVMENLRALGYLE